jgi:hypothetical protein
MGAAMNRVATASLGCWRRVLPTSRPACWAVPRRTKRPVGALAARGTAALRRRRSCTRTRRRVRGAEHRTRRAPEPGGRAVSAGRVRDRYPKGGDAFFTRLRSSWRAALARLED